MAAAGGGAQVGGRLTGPDDLRETLAKFRALPEYSEEASWLRLTETLLLFCRRNRPAAAAWDGLPPGLVESVLSGVEAAVTAVLDAHPASRFPAEGQLDALAAVMERELSQPEVGDETLHAGLVARGLAGGIDAVHGDRFVDWFRSQIEVPIREDVGYVTTVHDPRPFMGAQHVNSRPDCAPSRGLDVVPHLRLGDTTSATYRFVLDFDMYFHLAPLADAHSGIGLAAAQPNLSIAEFDVERLEGPPRTFRNKGAVNPERQGDLVIAAVQAAAANGAAVVVVPEYCLPDEQRRRVAAEINMMSPRPALVVGGTCEVPDPEAGGNRNEAWIYVPDDPDLSYEREVELPAAEQRHDDAGGDDAGGGDAGADAAAGDPTGAALPGRSAAASKVYPAEDRGGIEAIVSPTEVPVFFTESFTFAVLICRDAMSNELVDAMADIGVNLLLVPAFSPKTGTIIGNVVTLCTRSQAFVVVACAPAFWSEDEGDAAAVRDGSKRAEAAFDGPYDSQPGPRSCPSPAAPVSGRGVWVFDTAFRSVRWLPIQ